MQTLAQALVAAVKAGIAKAKAEASLVGLQEDVVTSGKKPAPKKKLVDAGAASNSKKISALTITNYHEAPRGSARATAEQLLLLSKARG